MSAGPRTVAVEIDTTALDRLSERLAAIGRAARLAATQQHRFRGLFQQMPDPWALAHEQERRDANALARRAAELSETTGPLTPAWDLLALARSMGGSVQGIRYGQHWKALVPPHARHLIADRSKL